MQITVRKRHEDEWWVQIGVATLKLSFFQMALLEVILSQAGRLTAAGQYDLLDGFIALAQRLRQLDDAGLQKLLQQTADEDWVQLLRVLDDPAFQLRVLRSAGPLVARQMEADLAQPVPVDEAAVQQAIERIMKRAFEMEAAGEIVFHDDKEVYI